MSLDRRRLKLDFHIAERDTGARVDVRALVAHNRNSETLQDRLVEILQDVAR